MRGCNFQMSAAFPASNRDYTADFFD